MELDETIDLMLSDDYKERFFAEYHQVRTRAWGLARMLDDWRDGTLDFEPQCSYDLLHAQYFAMCSYVAILKERAKIEGIKL